MIVSPFCRMNQYPFYLFDLDGTLVDSMWIWRSIDKVFLDQRGLPHDPIYLAGLKSLNVQSAATWTKSYFKLQESEADLVEAWAMLAEKAYTERVELKPGAKAYLTQAKATGKKIGLFTASEGRWVYPLLKRLGIQAFFDEVVFVSDCSGMKDQPTVWLEVAERLGAKREEILVFEDNVESMVAIREAGLALVAIEDESNREDRDQMKTLASQLWGDFTDKALL